MHRQRVGIEMLHPPSSDRDAADDCSAARSIPRGRAEVQQCHRHSPAAPTCHRCTTASAEPRRGAGTSGLGPLHPTAHGFRGSALQRGTCKDPQSAVQYRQQFPNHPQIVGKGVVVARRTPHVDGPVLVGLPGSASDIAVVSPAWYAWLEGATTFAFTSAQGGFTARKERRGQSGWYWKAYRKRDGMLFRAYLGKAADLTLDQL